MQKIGFTLSMRYIFSIHQAILNGYYTLPIANLGVVYVCVCVCLWGGGDGGGGGGGSGGYIGFTPSVHPSVLPSRIYVARGTNTTHEGTMFIH